MIDPSNRQAKLSDYFLTGETPGPAFATLDNAYPTLEMLMPIFSIAALQYGGAKQDDFQNLEALCASDRLQSILKQMAEQLLPECMVSNLEVFFSGHSPFAILSADLIYT